MATMGLVSFAIHENQGLLMGRHVPGFLTTPYDDCTFFQSQSTELVVFSPSAGEYVVIAW
jgi:hypothetical protein